MSTMTYRTNLRSSKAAVRWMPFPSRPFRRSGVHNSRRLCRSLIFGWITVGAETKDRGACNNHERAERPKGGFVGMQPLERQTHHGGPDRGADDKEGEQVSVQQPEAFHSEISGRQESDHVDFGAGCQTEADDARNRRDGAVEQIDSETREQEKEGRDERREDPVDQISGQ